jgi:hypothetical protein
MNEGSGIRRKIIPQGLATLYLNGMRPRNKKGSAGRVAAFCVVHQSYSQFLWISLCSYPLSKQEKLADRSLA